MVMGSVGWECQFFLFFEIVKGALKRGVVTIGESANPWIKFNDNIL